MKIESIKRMGSLFEMDLEMMQRGNESFNYLLHNKYLLGGKSVAPKDRINANERKQRECLFTILEMMRRAKKALLSLVN